jgi:hypothetical protein
MERRDLGSQHAGADSVTSPAVAGHVRFRTESEPGIDNLNRRWQAIYAHGQGWARFRVVIDLSRHICTFYRVPESDYSALLRELAGKSPEGMTPIPPPSKRVDSLSFDMDIVGLKMPRVRPGGTTTTGPAGDWLVVQAYLPGSTQSFLFGVSNRLGAGEIVVPKAEWGPAVVHSLAQVFG